MKTTLKINNTKGINILSLFDGMSCGYQALKEAGVKVTNYYASEIDKFAISVAMANHPDIIQLGDVTRWQEWQIDWSSIDLVIGGSPCQGFSFAGKRLCFGDERSKLILFYFDILKHIQSVNPSVKFLLENVKMGRECEKIINERLGVEGVHINSNLFSAQTRDRIYWTNLRIDEVPSFNTLAINDIVESGADEDTCLYLTKKHWQGFLRNYDWKSDHRDNKSKPLLASYYKQPPHCPYIPHNRDTDEQYSLYRRLSPMECERLQTLPDGYTAHGVNGEKISNCQRYKMLGNGWTVAVIKHLLNELTESKDVFLANEICFAEAEMSSPV